MNGGPLELLSAPDTSAIGHPRPAATAPLSADVSDTTIGMPAEEQRDSAATLGPAADELTVENETSAKSLEQDFADRFTSLPPFPIPWRQPLRCLGWLIQVGFGLVSLGLLLAILAAVPVLNLLALGYLLEAEGRVAKTGQWRYAFPLLPIAPKLGSILLGVYLFLWPVRVFASLAADASLVAPGSFTAGGWWLFSRLWMLATAVHLVCAIARGGSPITFVRPIKNVRWLISQLRAGTYLDTAETAVREFVRALKLQYHFSLGLRGYLGALAWLVLPTGLFAAVFAINGESAEPGRIAVTLLGGLALLITLTWVPLLQCHFAAENRFRAMFDLKHIRELWRRAPLFLALGTVLMFALTIPLYLFKIYAPPRDAQWLMTPIFLILIYPVRLLMGWLYSWASTRQHRTWLVWRWLWSLVLIPVLAIYLGLLFLTPAINAHGRQVLFEQPAIMLPSPF